MPKQMKILLVSPEIHPFAKTGGLADIAGVLPKALRQMGHDIRVIMPKYKCINTAKFKIEPLLIEIKTPVGKLKKRGELFAGKLNKNIPSYFIGNDNYYYRDGLYNTSGGDFPDNAERFIFFCRSVLEACKALSFRPDIIHCHDWQTGLIPVYLKTLYASDEFFKNTRTVFTIHNLGYQGNFWHFDVPLANLPWELFTPEGVEFYGKFSFMKSGLIYADALTTVSPTYSKEIRTEEFGFGLDGILRRRAKDLHGILNGVDYEEWDPEHDLHIKKPYSPKNTKGKQACRDALVNLYSLRVEEKSPILCMVARFSQQKGLDLIMEGIDRIMATGAAFIMLGAGDAGYQSFFANLSGQYKGRFVCKVGFDEASAHQIIAGSDIILIPSQYEPCGLTQIYGLKYGTVPVARAVGGLQDTVKEFNIRTCKGTGFKFKPFET
ncbi:MAG: hypothetical protein A3K09_01525, partial [Nitrospinae bacterium RIFCSPLOWO2_12_FULL_47_7]